MGLFSRRRRAVRWFFATDIHGSDRCYRKFLAAARVYNADVLVLGGDVAGKGIVPIVAEGPRYRVTFQGREESIEPEGLQAVCDRIGFNGLYPYVCQPVEAEALHDPVARDALFDDLIAAQIRSWARLTEERLSEQVRCIVTPGNDDPRVVDEELAAAERVESPEAQVAEVGPVTLASLGNTNHTPWHTDREYDEDALAAQIDAVLSHNGHEHKPLVFNFHCPPYSSGLDVAPELDDELRPVIRNGHASMVPVGSTAVRDAIERYAPVVGLHGHIHESHGRATIGKSRCFNPGSDYSSGVLKGLIVDFDAAGACVGYLFTSG
jgi:uncharacterized protein